VAGAIVERYPFEQQRRPVARGASAGSGKPQWNGDIVKCRQRWNEIERLEHEPDGPTAIRQQILVVESGDISTIQNDLSSRRSQYAAEA
jgi:hypothetical protein